ncbi:MAG TPA: tetraacyldisaccharide 4'-kinase, partial [Thermoanaerobaculia bacterium]
DPFGGGRLLPSGRLREPLAAVSRADAAILTGVAPEEAATAGAELASALRSRGFRGPGFASVSKTAPPYLVTASGREPLPAGSQVVLASAVARPEAFASAVRGHGYTIAAELRFPDHHRYPAASLARIEAAFRDSGAVAVVATEKDRVKLAGRLAVPLAALPLTACPEPAFWTWLDAAVERLR